MELSNFEKYKKAVRSFRKKKWNELVYLAVNLLQPVSNWFPAVQNCQTTHHIYNRVANVVADHDDLLIQWRPIKMSKFSANIFLIQSTSNYFWASEVFKNQRFKSHLFSFSSNKKYPKLKTWDNFYAIIIFY